MKTQICITDGPKRYQKEVKVTLLDQISKDENYIEYWCEYPKGFLNIALHDLDENCWSTNHDVSMEEITGLSEKQLKSKAKQYNLK